MVVLVKATEHYSAFSKENSVYHTWFKNNLHTDLDSELVNNYNKKPARSHERQHQRYTMIDQM